MGKRGRPKLTDKEIISAVADRTGLPYNATYQTIFAFYDVIKECIENGVDAKIGELGTMTYQVKSPRYGAVFADMYNGGQTKPRDIPGYWVPYLSVRKKWKNELRAQTEFWNKENEGK